MTITRTASGPSCQEFSHFDFKYGTAPALEQATIVIVKDAVPDDPQDFAFTSDIPGCESFSLDDDSDGTLSNTKTCSSVSPDTYSVSETVPTGWALTSATCDDGSPVSAISLQPGETVTCTFTNTRKTADLSITKTDSHDPVTPGSDLTYTIKVTNNGPGTATSVTVTDTLPSGVTFVSSTPGSPTCTESGGTVTCNLGDLAPNATETITIVVNVKPTATGKITNTAEVKSKTDEGENTAANIATADTQVNPLVLPCKGTEGGVTASSAPPSVTYKPKKKTPAIANIILIVTNNTNAPINVTSISPQAGEPFTITAIAPALPRTIPACKSQRFKVTTRLAAGQSQYTATRPYFNINIKYNGSTSPLTTASLPQPEPLSLAGVHMQLRAGQIQLQTEGTGIESVQLLLFDLRGRKLIDHTSESRELTLPAETATGQRLANGVYLYVVTVRGFDGSIIHSEVRKLVILR